MRINPNHQTMNRPSVEETLKDPSVMERAAERAMAAVLEEQRKTASTKLDAKADDAKAKGARSWLT